MSLTRKTYSPVRHSFTFSSAASPSYSYSRVSTYLDALERDDQINKLKRQLTNVKSLEMKYYSLLQEIALAEKENRMLEVKNENVEQEYVAKVQEVRRETAEVEGRLEMINVRLTEEERKVEEVEDEIQDLLEQLKQLKVEEESVQSKNAQLQQEIQACNSHISRLAEEQTELSTQKSALCTDSKLCTQQMECSMRKLTQMTQKVAKYTEELAILQTQTQCFALECQNMETLCAKNTALIQNLERKVTIQEGENQQIKNQLNAAQQEWDTLQSKLNYDKENLYQNVIKVEEQSMVLKQTLGELDTLLEKDSTEKKYLKDISTKHAMLSGQNQEMRQVLKHLQEAFNEKKAQETALVQQISRRLKSDDMLKCAIDQRDQELAKLKMRFTTN